LCDDEDGGVLGRAEVEDRDLKSCLSIVALPVDQEECQTYKLSNFSISAWEYEAPTTNPGSRLCFFGDKSRRPSDVRLRQKGEADLRVTVSALPLVGHAPPASNPIRF